MNKEQVWAKFVQECPEVAASVNALVASLMNQPGLDVKTKHLVRIAVQTVQKNEWALRGHVSQAKELGATRAEVVDAVLSCLPGSGVPATLTALMLALEEYDGE